jgi:hypothetical protein
MKSGAVSGDEGAYQGGLRVISSAPEHRRSDQEPEMKAIKAGTRKLSMNIE